MARVKKESTWEIVGFNGDGESINITLTGNLSYLLKEVDKLLSLGWELVARDIDLNEK
jgi:hypothetical protein